MKSVFESEKINYIHVSLDLIDDYLIMVNDREIQKCISTKIRVYSREDEVNWVKAKLEEGAQVFSMISKEDGSFLELSQFLMKGEEKIKETRLREKRTYVEPADYFPKEIREKYFEKDDEIE